MRCYLNYWRPETRGDNPKAPAVPTSRAALGVKPGDKLLVVVHGDSLIVIQKPQAYHSAIRGLAKGRYPRGYLQKERQSWD